MWANIFAAINSWKTFLLIALLVVLALVWLRFAPKVPSYTPKKEEVTVATKPKVITKVKYITVPGPSKIMYLDKKGLEVKLKMPELENLTDNVLSVATAPSHTGDTTILATLSPEGRGGILLRKEPQKFFQVKKEFVAEGRYMLTGNNQAEIDLKVLPLRVGPVEFVGAAGVEVHRSDGSMGFRSYIGVQYQF